MVSTKDIQLPVHAKVPSNPVIKPVSRTAQTYLLILHCYNIQLLFSQTIVSALFSMIFYYIYFWHVLIYFYLNFEF